MSDEALPAARAPKPRHRRVPARTMATWLVLIPVVFLTQGRWEAWAVEQVLPEVARCRFPAVAADDKLLLSYYRGEWYLLLRQRYFFTAEIAENAENGELYCALLSESPVVYLPFPCFLPFSASSAASAVRSRVVGLVRCQDR